MKTVREVLDDKGSVVLATPPDATVLDAVDTMCWSKVGALLVCDGDHPIGIVSERDILTRVVLTRRDPASTPVAEIMTRELVCVSRTTKVDEAMQIMTQKRCRHLPVVEQGRVIGIVSIGDLVRLHIREEEYEVQVLMDYLRGTVPPPPAP